MPMPRFERLAPDRRAAILRVARERFAADGVGAASFNKIIEAARISKTAAYQYFDGREDLLSAVLTDVRDRLLHTLGDWQPAGSEEEFWRQLSEGAARLAGHMAGHPDDLALADAALASAGSGYLAGYLAQVLADGRELGVVRDDIHPDLLLAVTSAVFAAADTWFIDAMRTGAADADAQDQVWGLLAGLWKRP